MPHDSHTAPSSDRLSNPPDRSAKDRAEAVCAALNADLGWAGAQPEYRRDGYTGAITVSARAAEEIATTVLEARVRRLDARTRTGAHTTPESPLARGFSEREIPARALRDLLNVGTAEDPRR
jgi:hypothetical protein